MTNKNTEIVANNNIPMSTFHSADLLITKLAGKDVDIDKMEKLLALKGKYEAEENKKLFQLKFSELQAELPIIQKTKEIKNNNGKVLYRYAPLEKIIEQIKPIMKKYGFSYRWSEGISEDKNSKRIWCHIMAYGHEEKNYVDIPILEANNLINKAQQAGSVSTYGKRYSLIGALGIMADEDDDAISLTIKKESIPKKQVDKAELIDKIKKQYVRFRTLAKPNDKIEAFMSHIDLEDITPLEGFSKRLDQLILKHGKGK